MRQRMLGKTNIVVSEVGLGTMTFGWTADEVTAHAIMDVAFDAGIKFFDTADLYARWLPHSHAGRSEEIIGRWLKHRQRDEVVIATKVRGQMSDDPRDQGLSRRHIMAAVEGSLRRLQTDYIDLYQTHWPDEETPLEATLRALDDLQRDGKVRAIGCSNSPAWYTMKALWLSDKYGLARYESLQPHYNLVHRAEFERELQPLALDQQLGVIPYSPLAGGFLSGKYRQGQPAPTSGRAAGSSKIKQYMAADRNFDIIERLGAVGQWHNKSIPQVALAWLIDAPAVTAPIVGASSLDQLHESLGAIGFSLSSDERQQLDQLSDWN